MTDNLNGIRLEAILVVDGLDVIAVRGGRAQRTGVGAWTLTLEVSIGELERAVVASQGGTPCSIVTTIAGEFTIGVQTSVAGVNADGSFHLMVARI